MDPERLVETVIRGVLGGRRKRNRGALRFLTGGRHSLLNAGTLLAAAGVAWGLYETAAGQNAANAGAASGPVPHGPVPSQPAAGGQSVSASPPLPSTASATASPVPVNVSQDVLRVIRLTIAAARADGTLTPKEEAAILAHARTVGAESLVAQELQHPMPLAALLAGVPPAQHHDLYTLAFAIARADESVSGGERIFLAQLAHHLGLDVATTAELERAAVERIAAGATQGSLM